MKTIFPTFALLLLMLATVVAKPEAGPRNPDTFAYQTEIDHIVSAFKKEGSADRYVSLQHVYFCSHRRLLTDEERKAYVRIAADTLEKVGIESADKPDYRQRLQTAILERLKQAAADGPVDSVRISTVVIR